MELAVKVAARKGIQVRFEAEFNVKCKSFKQLKCKVFNSNAAGIESSVCM